MKKILAILLATAMLAATAGCGTPAASSSSDAAAPSDAAPAASTDAAAPAEGEKPTVALIIPTLTTDFFVTMKDAAVKYAEEKNVELIVLDSQDDAAKMASNVEDVITKKVDFILLTPTDSDASVTSVEAANAAGIPVITIDRTSNGGEVFSHIASDNVAGGKMAGDYIAEKLGGKGNVVELQGIPGASAATDRGQGFNDAMAANADIKVVAAQTANFAKAEGMTVTENILQAQESVDAIFAHNDEMALGAVEAVAASGRTDIMIVGFDAAKDAVAAVEAGTMAATVAQNPSLMIQTGIDSALKVLAGETIETSIPVALDLVTKD